jgi:hypothetical protein
MKLFKATIASEMEVLVAGESAESLVKDGQWVEGAKGYIGECLRNGLNHRIVSLEAYDGPIPDYMKEDVEL